MSENETRKNEKIRVLRIEPRKAPEVTEIENGLESLQHQVEGYIECVYPYDDPVCLIVNEEGKINCMELNRALKDENGEIYDIVAGPFLVAGTTDDNFCSLTDELLEKYQNQFKNPEAFIRIDGKIHVLPIEIEAVTDTRDCRDYKKTDTREDADTRKAADAR